MNTLLTVKKRAAIKRQLIDDKTLFTSSNMQSYLKSISSGFLRKIHCSIKSVAVHVVYNKNDETVAYTDTYKVYINAGCDLVREQTDQTQRLRAVRGLLAHELGHVAYTNFSTAEICVSRLSNGVLFPDPVESPSYWFKPGLDGFKNALADPAAREIVLHIVNEVSNELEDGYIEERIIEGRHGILTDDLELVRQTHFQLTAPLHQMIEMESEGKLHRFQVISALLLSYAKFGDIRYDRQEDLDTSYVRAINRCLPYIDEYIDCKDSLRRHSLLYTVLCLLWHEIDSFIEWVKEIQKTEKQQEGSEESTSQAASVTKAMPKSGQAPQGTTSNTAQDQGKDSNESSCQASQSLNTSRKSARQKVAQQIKEAAKSQDNEELNDQKSGNADPGHTANKADEDTKSEGFSGKEENADPKEERTDGKAEGFEVKDKTTEKLQLLEPNDLSDSGESPKQCLLGDDNSHSMPVGSDNSEDERNDVSEEEGGRFNDLGEGRAEDSDGDGGTDYEEIDGNDAYKNAAADIERLLDNVATDIAEAELDAEQASRLALEAKAMDIGDIHKNIKINIERMTIVPDWMVKEYSKIEPAINVIVTHTSRKLEQVLKDKRQGGKKSNLYMGRRFESRSVYREDGRVFYNQKLPGGPPQVAFALLLDESGSMSAMDRATYARMTALIMYGVCQRLNIPLTIYGHTTGMIGETNLYLYAGFDSYDQKDKYRMMDISARNANRDGAALRFVGEQLLKRPEETKVLFFVCDGQPSDYNYYGDEAEKDLREIKAYLKRKGVDLVVAAIGEDKENIRRIYGDAFMDITNLKKLPTILPQKLLSYIPE